MPIFQPELETLPRPELERLQRKRLRARFGVALETLPEQPFRVKSELRDAYPFGLLQVPLEECVRIHASSRTRGKATIVAYTRADITAWADCCARALATAGAGPGTVVHVAYDYGLFTGGLGLHYGAERLGWHGGSGLRRQHPTAGTVARGPRCRDPLLHTELRARDRRSRPRRCPSQPPRRRLPGGAVDRGTT